MNRKRMVRALILVATAGAACVAVVVGCSGPVPLSAAIRPDDQRAYLTALADHQGSARDAFYAWKGATTGRSVDAVATADQALSTTRNPFDAYRDTGAVSRGAVIYRSHCMLCHGEDVRGRGPAMPADLPKMDFHSFGKRFAATLHRGAPRSWFKKINEGYTSKVVNADGSLNTMTAFKDVLAREQIWLAITYLQSLDIHSNHDGGQPSK